jgi:hypothetical protein
VLVGGEHGGGSRRPPTSHQPFPLPRVITRGLFATVRAHCRVNPSPTLACARKSVKNTVCEPHLGARCEPPMLAVAVCVMPVGCPDDTILIAWAEWASSRGARVPPPHTWETKHCVSAVGSAVCARLEPARSLLTTHYAHPLGSFGHWKP